MLGEKIVKDIVHGYIAIPKEYFTYIIDTEFFQRLRRIEQSSMRVVYPCGRHDRFIHSIGVYYLGKMAFKSFRKNCTSEKSGLKGIDDRDFFYAADDIGFWKRSQFNFEMACLLHDVGHTPLSHTTENFYKEDIFQYDCEKEDNQLPVEISELLNGKSKLFYLLYKAMVKVNAEEKDITQILNSLLDEDSSTKVHEIMSSILILEKFVDPIINVACKMGFEKIEVDFIFIIRCIMGIPYIGTEEDKLKILVNKNAETQIKDIIISLLNGSNLDVDKLDYFQRDVMMSGFNTASIDIERLINAFTVEYQNGRLNLALQGQALSVVQSIIQINNDLYTWIYGHHKVVYEHRVIEDILTMALVKDGGWKEFFTYEYMKENLVTDDDLWVRMKNERKYISQVDELLERKAKLRPIWKSTAEFHIRCKELYKKIPSGNYQGEMYVSYIHELCKNKTDEGEITKFIETKLGIEGSLNIMIEKGKTRDMKRKDWKIRIEIKKQFTDLWQLMEPVMEDEKERDQSTNLNTIYFYLYLSDEALKKLDNYKEKEKKDVADILIEFVNEREKIESNYINSFS